MKQQTTTVLIGILSLIAATNGHAELAVKIGWTEPIVTWIAVVLKTGKPSICRTFTI